MKLDINHRNTERNMFSITIFMGVSNEKDVEVKCREN